MRNVRTWPGVVDVVDEDGVSVERAEPEGVELVAPRVQRARGLCEALYWCGLLLSAAGGVALASVLLLALDPGDWVRWALGHGIPWLVLSCYLYRWSSEGRTWPRPE